MSEPTNIILQFYSDQSVHRFELSFVGHVLSSQYFSGIEALPPQGLQQRCMVLLPGHEIFVDQVCMPSTRQQNVLKALPFLLEDKLADRVEKFHFFANKIPHSNEYLIAAMDRQRFESYFSVLQQYNVKPEAIIPDFLALPYVESQWTVKINDKGVLVRCGYSSGFATYREQLAFALKLKAKEIARSQQIVLKFVGELSEMTLLKQQLDSVFTLKLHDNAAPFDTNLFNEKPLLNLLQAPYRLKSIKKSQDRYWHYVGYAFVFWIVLLFSGKTAQWIYYQYQEAQLTEKIMAITREIFPNQHTISDPNMLLQRVMKNLSYVPQKDHFMLLLSYVGAALRQSSKIELQSLNYQGQQLSLVVKAKTLSIIENFSRALEQNHLTIKQNQVSTGEKEMTAQLIVESS